MNNSDYAILSQEIKAQSEFALRYATGIVSSLVKDANLASQVNAALTAKLTDQKNKFVDAVQNESVDADLTVEFK